MLYVCMPEGQGTWLWCIDGQQWQSEDNLEQLIQHVQLQGQMKQVVVFFPSQTAQFDSQQLARAQYKQLGTQGIHYLLEDNSIEPIDHLSIFHHYQNDRLSMMALPHHLRETYQHMLALLPWPIEALLPDFLLVPEPVDGQLNLLAVSDRILWRWQGFKGWQCHDLTMLSLLLDGIETVKTYQFSLSQTAELEQQLASHTIDVTDDVYLLPDFSKAKRHPFNALVKVKQKKQGFNYWKACAALLVVAVLTQVSYDTLRWWKYKQIADQTAQLALAQYQQWFPAETRVNENNLVSQFTSKVRANATEDIRVLEMIAQVGPLLQQANVETQQVQYQDNSLSMSVLAQNAQILNQLSEQFKQQGLNAELGAIRNEGQKVLGMIKVQ